MSEAQSGILEPIPAVGRYLAFSLQTPQALPDGLRALQQRADGRQLVFGVGASLVRALGRELPGLRTYAASAPAGLDLPATPHALWCWLRGTQRGDLLQLSRELELALRPAFRLQQVVDAFKHRGGLDLTSANRAASSCEKRLRYCEISLAPAMLDSRRMMVWRVCLFDSMSLAFVGRASARRHHHCA